MNKGSKLSVIVPTYRQEKSIEQDLKNIISTLERIDYDWELIVVVDGILDKTFEKAKKIKHPKVKVVALDKNHGKGYAVRYGMARSSGNMVAFLDGGMEINPEGINLIIKEIEEKQADIVIGSKRHPDSKVSYPPIRRVLSFGYQLLTFVLFGLKVRDTQVGLKIFKRKVLEDVLPRLLVKRYAFDVEILSVANYLGYNNIFEAPIELNYQFGVPNAASVKTIINMLIDTLAIFYRLKIKHYYSDNNKRKWVYDPELDFRVNIG